MAPPSRTNATTAGPASAPPSPRDVRGEPSWSARSGGWRRQQSPSVRQLGSPGQPPLTTGSRPRGLRQPRRPPQLPRQQALPPRPGRGPKVHRGPRPRPQQAAPRPRPRPLARRQRGEWPRRRPLAPRRGLPRPQRGAGKVHKELRPRPRRAAPTPRPATPQPLARRGRGGRTPRGPRAPRQGPPQQQQWAGRARSTPGRLARGRRSSSSGQGGREVPRPRQPHPHPHQPPMLFPPKPFPTGRTRHVCPRAPERSQPGVTLPRVQRHQDARRLIREGGGGAQAGQGASHGSAERGTGGDRGSAQGHTQEAGRGTRGKG